MRSTPPKGRQGRRLRRRGGKRPRPEWMDAAGVRGVRFNFLKRLVDFTPRDVLSGSPPGWRRWLAYRCVLRDARPAGFRGFFHLAAHRRGGRPHGYADVKKGVDHPDNQRFHRLLEQHQNFWGKATCPERMTRRGAAVDDVVPFGRALVERSPIALSGAPTGRIPMFGWRRTTAYWLITSRKIAPTATLQQKLWSTTRCGFTGASRSLCLPGRSPIAVAAQGGTRGDVRSGSWRLARCVVLAPRRPAAYA